MVLISYYLHCRYTESQKQFKKKKKKNILEASWEREKWAEDWIFFIEASPI